MRGRSTPPPATPTAKDNLIFCRSPPPALCWRTFANMTVWRVWATSRGPSTPWPPSPRAGAVRACVPPCLRARQAVRGLAADSSTRRDRHADRTVRPCPSMHRIGCTCSAPSAPPCSPFRPALPVKTRATLARDPRCLPGRPALRRPSRATDSERAAECACWGRTTDDVPAPTRTRRRRIPGSACGAGP